MDTTATRHSGLTRSLVTVVLATAVLLTLLPLLAKPAAAAGYATSGGFGCDTQMRRVLAFPPQMTSTAGQAQVVYFSPDLYRWNGSSWRLYDGSRPWYWGVANGYGVQYNANLHGNWFVQTNALRFVPFAGLPSGYYRVADYYRWGATGYYAPRSFVASGSAWAPSRTAARFCYMP